MRAGDDAERSDEEERRVMTAVSLLARIIVPRPGATPWPLRT